jgi:SLT domain-containing protein
MTTLISGHQEESNAINGNQWQSKAIKGHPDQ